MEDIYKNRLLSLATFLDTLPPEKFEFKIWVNKGFVPGTCPTTACAIGWAAQMPEFQALGLVLKQDESEVRWREDHRSCAEESLCRFWPTLEHSQQTPSPWSADQALYEIFNIDPGEVEYLFVPSDMTKEDCDDDLESLEQLPIDATPVDVATRIRHFVEVLA